MPASQAWIAIYSRALLETTYAYNYEQLHDTDLTPEFCAAEAYTRYQAWLSSECSAPAGPCETPAGTRIYRRNPSNGRYEYADGDEWVEPTGDEAIPEPTARAEPTDDEKLCAAAANVENVLHDLWDYALDLWNDEILPEVAGVDFWTTASLLLGSAFYPPLLGVLAIEEIAFSQFYGIMDVLTTDMWDAALSQKLTCIFLDNASIAAGVVTFDLQGIQKDLWTGAVSLETYLLQASQVQYLLSTIGAQGVNIAGTTTAVTGDCAECGTWCMNFDFVNGPQDWTALRETVGIVSPGGVFSGGGWDGTIQTNTPGARSMNATIGIQFPQPANLTKITYTYDRTNGQFDNTIYAQRWRTNTWDLGAAYGSAAATTLRADLSPGAAGTNLTLSWTGDLDGIEAVVFSLAASTRANANPSPLGSCRVRSIQLEGNGDNPFGASNC